MADDVSVEARTLYERVVVFDANAYLPSGDTIPVPPDLLETTRRSGVTALKWTLGGVDAGLEATLADIACVQRMIEAHPDVFMQVRVALDFDRARRERRLGIVLSFESVEMLGDRIERIGLFRNRGVRVMQLCYNKASRFAAGALADPAAGLTDLGHEAVYVMNQEGVAIDISHANRPSSLDVIATSRRPVLITHAGCAAIHDHPRNKRDDLLRAVAEKGGVVGIYNLPYLAASPRQPELEDYMAHMVHALEVCGEDHVGVGSDASLAPWDTSPEGLEEFRNVSEYRRKTGIAAPEEDRPLYVVGLNHSRRIETIADALLTRGYPARVAEKVIGANFIRALTTIWT